MGGEGLGRKVVNFDHRSDGAFGGLKLGYLLERDEAAAHRRLPVADLLFAQAMMNRLGDDHLLESVDQLAYRLVGAADIDIGHEEIACWRRLQQQIGAGACDAV